MFQEFEIGFRGALHLDQLGLFISQHFGLRFRHPGSRQALDECVGVKGNGAHRGNLRP